MSTRLQVLLMKRALHSFKWTLGVSSTKMFLRQYSLLKELNVPVSYSEFTHRNLINKRLMDINETEVQFGNLTIDTLIGRSSRLKRLSRGFSINKASYCSNLNGRMSLSNEQRNQYLNTQDYSMFSLFEQRTTLSDSSLRLNWLKYKHIWQTSVYLPNTPRLQKIYKKDMLKFLFKSRHKFAIEENLEDNWYLNEIDLGLNIPKEITWEQVVYPLSLSTWISLSKWINFSTLEILSNQSLTSNSDYKHVHFIENTPLQKPEDLKKLSIELTKPIITVFKEKYNYKNYTNFSDFNLYNLLLLINS